MFSLVYFSLTASFAIASMEATPEITEVSTRNPLESFFIAFVTIVISELGDKTFFIAAIMAMKNDKKFVMLGASMALAIMTILSVLFGLLLPQLLSKTVTTALAAFLFLIFGIKMISEYSSISKDKGAEEMELVRAEIDDPNAHASSSMEMGHKEIKKPNRILSFINPVFAQVFSMTFLAEWGDRSQITTIALAASHSAIAITIGAIIGHIGCSAIAVLGGQLLASKISIKKDQVIRENAEKALQQAANDNLPMYLILLCQELANEEKDPFMRTAAGLAIKNTFVAKDSYKRNLLAQQWVGMDAAHKSQIKLLAMQSLKSKDSRVGTAAAQVVAAVAFIELPRREWPELIQVLVSNIAERSNGPNVAKASLEAIGFICEEIEPTVLEFQSNEILTAVIDGMQRTENAVRQSAVMALFNSLEFVGRNFENEAERNYIMKVVCEATQSKDDLVCISAFECLVKIMQLYYEKMAEYMRHGLFALTASSMGHENEQIALQAVEFWSTVCETEMEIEMAGDDSIPLFHFARAALNDILPTLLTLLTKQEHDCEEDWNLAMASATCIALLSQSIGDEIVAPIMNFVQSNLVQNNWHLREAALMAFGSCLEGPSFPVCEPYVKQALPMFVKMMKDSDEAVRDTNAWVIGRIVELAFEAIESSLFADVVHTMCEALKDIPRVATNAAWCLMNMALQIDAANPSNPLAPHFQPVVTSLLTAAERPDADSCNLRAASYQALADVISSSSSSSTPLIAELTKLMISKFESTFIMEKQVVGIEDSLRISDIQGHLCTILQNATKKLGKNIQPFSAKLMETYLHMFTTGKSSHIYEDVFLAVGALIMELEKDFIPFMNAFVPILYKALENYEEQQLISVSVGVVGDLCRAMQQDITPFCDEIMNRLLQCLQNPSLHRDAKPLVLSAFGDVAIAIGANFVKYLDISMMILSQAQAIQLSPDDIDYGHQLRESVLEAYSCIINGLKSGQQSHLLLPHIEKMVSLAAITYTDQERTDSLTRLSIGLLGDIAESVGPQAKQFLSHDWIITFIKANLSGKNVSESTQSVAEWALSVIRQVVSK